MNSNIETIKVTIRHLNIHDETEKQASLYLELANQAEKLLKQVYQAHNLNLKFPVDIELIVREMGFTIEKRRIYASATNQFNKVLGRILVDKNEKLIEIDNTVSNKTQQYAIAHSIGRYLLLEDNTLLKYSYAIPLMPSELGEIAADKIALFLLLPLNVFKQEFKDYLETIKNYPLDVDRWLQYLSDKSQVSMFNLAIGYQQLKQVACQERLQEFEKAGYDLEKFNDTYAEIFA